MPAKCQILLLLEWSANLHGLYQMDRLPPALWAGIHADVEAVGHASLVADLAVGAGVVPVTHTPPLV